MSDIVRIDASIKYHNGRTIRMVAASREYTGIVEMFHQYENATKLEAQSTVSHWPEGLFKRRIREINVSICICVLLVILLMKDSGRNSRRSDLKMSDRACTEKLKDLQAFSLTESGQILGLIQFVELFGRTVANQSESRFSDHLAQVPHIMWSDDIDLTLQYWEDEDDIAETIVPDMHVDIPREKRRRWKEKNHSAFDMSLVASGAFLAWGNQKSMRTSQHEDGVDAFSAVWINWVFTANLLDKQLESNRIGTSMVKRSFASFSNQFR
jgi:hypothetical protein